MERRREGRYEGDRPIRAGAGLPNELPCQSDGKPRLLAEILAFVFVLALIGLNIGLLGFFSGRPVNSAYTNKWVHELGAGVADERRRFG